MDGGQLLNRYWQWLKKTKISRKEFVYLLVVIEKRKLDFEDYDVDEPTELINMIDWQV